MAGRLRRNIQTGQLEMYPTTETDPLLARLMAARGTVASPAPGRTLQDWFRAAGDFQGPLQEDLEPASPDYGLGMAPPEAPQEPMPSAPPPPILPIRPLSRGMPIPGASGPMPQIPPPPMEPTLSPDTPVSGDYQKQPWGRMPPPPNPSILDSSMSPTWPGQGKIDQAGPAPPPRWFEDPGTLQGITSLAETFGNIGQNMPNVAEYRLAALGKRVPQQQPFVATGAREAAAMAADKLTPQEAAFYGAKLGHDVSNIRRSTIQKLMPGLYGMQRSQYQMEHEAGIDRRAAVNADLRERTLGLSEDKFERSVENVPDVDRRTLTGYKSAMNSVAQLKARFDPSQIGPIQGRWQRLARRLGLNDPEAIRTAGDLRYTIMQQIYADSGKAINQVEIQNMFDSLPAVTDNPETFRLMLDGLNDRLRNKYDTTLQLLKTQGRNTAPYQDGDGNGVQTAAPGGTSGGTQEFTHGGKVYTIPADKVEAFIKAFPNATQR